MLLPALILASLMSQAAPAVKPNLLEISQFKKDFNAAKDDVRVVIVLAPS